MVSIKMLSSTINLLCLRGQNDSINRKGHQKKILQPGINTNHAIFYIFVFWLSFRSLFRSVYGNR